MMEEMRGSIFAFHLQTSNYSGTKKPTREWSDGSREEVRVEKGDGSTTTGHTEKEERVEKS